MTPFRQTSLLFSLLMLCCTPLVANNNTPRGTKTSAPYAIGDYYNEDGLEGVVFAISEDGKSGTILSLSEVKGVRQWASTPEAQRRFFDASSISDGMANFQIVENLEQWQTHFPAFAYCASLGEGWYLPSIHELKEILLNPLIYPIINKTLTQLNATPLPDKNTWVDYWSSTEFERQYASGEFCAYGVNTKNGITKDNGKSRYAKVRAVAAFPRPSTPISIPYTTSAPYAIGDYYNDGSLKGVVCEVDQQGQHGKLISLQQLSQKSHWALGEERQKVIGATDKSNGKKNMEIVMTIERWDEQYPAFAWCASLGQGWYLPAINELTTLFSNQEAIEKINATLHSKLSPTLHTIGTWNDYWSSTELPTIYTPDEEFGGEITANALGFYLYDSAAHPVAKGSDLCVRAMAVF